MFNIGYENSNLYYVIVLQSFETADEGSSSSSSSDQYEDCNDKTSLFKKTVKEKSDDGKTGLQLFEESEEESEQSEDDRFRIRPEYEGETGRKVGRLVFISHSPHPPLFTEYQQIYINFCLLVLHDMPLGDLFQDVSISILSTLYYIDDTNKEIVISRFEGIRSLLAHDVVFNRASSCKISRAYTFGKRYRRMTIFCMLVTSRC